MKKISVIDRAGAFSENKDIARDIRMNEVIPALKRNEKIVFDFKGVDAATQSFIHALLSDILRKYGVNVLDRMEFKSCNIKVQKMIEIVVEYMQEGMGIESGDD
ncbi:STAS-like domain-containing protein [bacterium]|nr:STAS-like domain-containing protein [bacterium]